MDIAQQSCTPCRGGIPPLSTEEAGRLSPEVPDWRILENPQRLVRDFAFRDFAEALTFVNAISRVAENEGHHPDIAFGWGYAAVTLYTHKIKGLHQNDFIMAAKFDRLYEQTT